ncbi:MAG: PAS domain-containing sensor histidine kinase [Cyanobacteriota bacterium]
MTLLAFLLGLAVGIGFWIWQRRRFQRQLGQMLGALETNASSAAMPVVSRLRQEITLANQHKTKLEEKLQTGRRLLEVAPIGYLQVDEENRLLWCNEQARQLLQIDRWEPTQLRLLLELVRSYELDQLIEQTRRQQQPAIQEWVFHPPCLDGAAMSEVRSLTLRASSWPLPQGQVGVFLENRQPLVELSQSRNQWVSDLAHELRTPLTSIRLVAEALQGRLENPALRWVEQLLHETNRLINLVQNWLELSNLEKNPSKSLTYQLVELRSLIQSVWQTLEPLAQQKQLCLAYLGADSIWLKADEARLTQVFLNLFDNSIKHSSSRETIRVKVTELQAEAIADEASSDPQSDSNGSRSLIQIDIIDAGTGFSESDLPHVFERLYRGDASRQKRQGTSETLTLAGSSGSGLGLSIVQQIILAHGGTVQARNHPETGGAWLQIKLPDHKNLR